MIHLKEVLDNLHNFHGLIYLKGGTEWEDMELNEISLLKSSGSPEIPTIIKVAGAEARVDIRNLQKMGIDTILGPMIESTYALEKFVATVSQIYERSEKKPGLAINIETINAVQYLDAIVSCSAFKNIDMVVIGRLDLSMSVGETNVDHPKIFELTKTIVDRVRAEGKDVSIGGFVNPTSAQKIQSTLNANRINTLHTMIDTEQASDISKSVELAIQFEIAFYEALKKENPERSPFYNQRIAISQKKLD